MKSSFNICFESLERGVWLFSPTLISNKHAYFAVILVSKNHLEVPAAFSRKCNKGHFYIFHAGWLVVDCLRLQLRVLLCPSCFVLFLLNKNLRVVGSGYCFFFLRLINSEFRRFSRKFRVTRCGFLRQPRSKSSFEWEFTQSGSSIVKTALKVGLP